jgi:hypothetical protein
MSYRFGTNLTRLGKRLLLIYGAIYIFELLCEHWLKIPFVSILQLYPFKFDNFHIWQIFTHPFIHNPQAPIGFLINCLVFYFFAAPVEHAFGSRRFLILFYLSALGGAICGLAFSSVSGFNAPFLGMLPSLLSLVVIVKPRSYNTADVYFADKGKVSELRNHFNNHPDIFSQSQPIRGIPPWWDSFWLYLF